MAKGNNARDKMMKERQKELVCRYRAHSFSFREIAEKVSNETGVKITHVTAYNDYIEALQEAQKQVKDMAVYSLVSQIEKLDRLEHQYWLAWDKSLGNTIKIKKKKRGTKKEGSELSEFEAEESPQNGDVAFLNGIKSCIELRSKLMGGLSTTLNVDLTTKGEKVEFKGFSFLPLTPEVDE